MRNYQTHRRPRYIHANAEAEAKRTEDAKTNGTGPDRPKPDSKPEPTATAPAKKEPAPWPVMAEEAFHGLAGKMVKTIAPQSESDPVALLVQFLAAAGNIIGRAYYYQVEATRHHANLYGSADPIDRDLAATWDRLHPAEPSGQANEQRPVAAYENGPQSWSAPMRQRLSSLPPEYRDVIDYATQRDREQHEAISRAGQSQAQIRQLAEQAGLPAEMPLPEMVQHLQHAFGPGPAAEQMRQMAEESQAYEPLKGVLEQYQDAFDHYGRPAHETIDNLLQMERALRTDPSSVLKIAEAYGYSIPQAEHVAHLQAQLAEVTQRESLREVEAFRQGKAYFDDAFMSELADEMQQLVNANPSLRGTGKALFKLAHDNLADRMGIGRQAEQQREQEVRQLVAQERARHRAEMQQLVAEFAKRETDREAQRQRAAEEHARQARKAARVNVKGSPGHNRNRTSFQNDDDTLRSIWNKNHT